MIDILIGLLIGLVLGTIVGIQVTLLLTKHSRNGGFPPEVVENLKIPLPKAQCQPMFNMQEMPVAGKWKSDGQPATAMKLVPKPPDGGQ
jgi:hypothetical protein